MKNISLYTVLAAMFIFGGCERDYIKYDTTQKDAVYFNMTADSDSLFYNFGFESITDTVIDVIRIYLMGMPVDRERRIGIVTDNGRYATDHFKAAKPQYYEIPDHIMMPANSVEVVLPIRLIRDPELETSRAVLTVVLTASDDLEIRGHDEFTIAFDDMVPTAPAWWRNMVYRLGDFSKVKYQLFLGFFWEMEWESPYFYSEIVRTFGRELKNQASQYASPFNEFPAVMNEIVQKLYDYQEANPGVISGVVKP